MVPQTNRHAHELMPDSVADSIPRLYTPEKERDRIAAPKSHTPDAVNRLRAKSQQFDPQEQATKTFSRVYGTLAAMARYQP